MINFTELHSLAMLLRHLLLKQLAWFNMPMRRCRWSGGNETRGGLEKKKHANDIVDSIVSYSKSDVVDRRSGYFKISTLSANSYLFAVSFFMATLTMMILQI